MHYHNIPFIWNIYRCLLPRHFPTSDAIWNIQLDRLYFYGLSGDTLIEDKSYNKLYLLYDTDLNIDSRDKYVGGFRQEDKKVWFRPSRDFFYLLYNDSPYPEETILYDFSKNVGDTIWHNSIIFGSHWAMKDSTAASIITSIDMDEQNHKIYHVELYEFYDGALSRISLRRESWIEGIGGIYHGLFWFLSMRPTCICPDYRLVCFKQGNEIKYTNNPDCNSCFECSVPGVDISEKNIISLEIVYENNNIRVKGGDPSVFPYELKLFSPIGQLILEKKLQSDKEEIPVNQLKGVYLYQVYKNNKTVKTGKIRINN
jgi:hypothetical protein